MAVPLIAPHGDTSGPTLMIGGRTRVIDGTLIMGVVNASPESFSDGGRYTSFQQLLEHAAALVESGADIIDVGGQSATTNQPEIDAELEVERVAPVIGWLANTYPSLVISVDTYKPHVAQAALLAGASIVNDVSGLAYPEVVGLCTQHNAALVVMHTAALPKVRLQDPDLYGDIAREVRSFLVERAALACDLGLPREALILDPGPDFTKTPHQTVKLLREIHTLRALGRPLLLALSRKDFLGAITGRTPAGRDAATAGALAFFASTPGSIVRVHDVAAARDVIATVETLAGLRDLDPDYLLSDELRYERPIK